MNRAALGWLALLLVFMGSTVIYLGWKMSRTPDTGASALEVDTSYRNVPMSSNEPMLTQFELTERSGKKVSSTDLDGRVYVTNFFFSSCPGTCLLQNQKVQEIQREFGKQGVQFVSITCDPEIDTPARLREYAHKLSADEKEWWFATGDLTYIRRIAGEIYKAPLDKQTHVDMYFVTDKWGNVRGHFEWNQLAKITEMKSLLAKLLTESEEPAEFKQDDSKTSESSESATNAPSAETSAKSNEEPSVTAEVDSKPESASSLEVATP
ncbi:electron transport protein SCO1/SenC [Pirellula staleyi DSM 6068]|uniref:Electron transport protein SCO1/SenC n=1 Tax=Pirellula staleyi (strain ATCC 27377 / DSM 6068 / ICPB 4128) TaxID=530564 RepID=D2R8P6_PIRSD|nr:SCO family protein [Pirellula staleyi]ADB17587.1 electron transport protein SCO1/SenC [Pirellula staleyi DSM 6068]